MYNVCLALGINICHEKLESGEIIINIFIDKDNKFVCDDNGQSLPKAMEGL